jgi:AcrR family transcriptional regulator
MSTLTRKSEITLGSIVAVATELAAAEGIGQLSLGEVAKRLGISKSGVFARVGSLESLQQAVLDESDRRFFVEVFQPSLELPAGLRRLDAMVARWIKRSVGADSADACIYTAGAFEYDDRDSPLRERLQQGVVRWRAMMRRTVLQAMELGHLRPDTDPEQLVFEISSLIVGLIHEARFMRDPSAERRIKNAYGRLVATYKSLHYQEEN